MWRKSNPDRPNVNFTQKREVDKLVNGHPQHDIKHYYEQRYFSGVDLISAEVILLREISVGTLNFYLALLILWPCL